MKLGAALVLACSLVALPAAGLVWPDVVEEVASGLRAPSPVTRRAAAERIASLGGGHAPALLRIALADSDVEVRTAAAQAAIRLHTNVATELVLPWFQERDVRLRVAACEVARAMPTPNALQPLGRAIADTESPLVRAAAADALGAQRSPEAVPPLLGRLDDPSPVVRTQVVKALAKQRDGRAVVPLVGKAQDSAPEVRQAVARSLGDLGDPRATQALVLLLRDSVLDVKVEAIGALGRMRAEGAISTLAPLASDRTLATRGAAMTALGQIGSKEAVRVLVNLLGQAEDGAGSLERTPVREALVLAGQAAIPDVAAALDSASAPARASSAAWVLGALHARAEAPRVVQALRRGVLPPAAALHALAGTGASESLPVVLEFLADSSSLVRTQAMRAAAALLTPSRPDGRAVEPILASLRVRGLTDDERAKLAALLGRTGAPRAAPPLVALLGAKEPALRLAAVDALGQLGPADADEHLLALLRDPDSAIRLRSAVALSKTGRDKAREALVALIDGGDGIDRAAVLTALGGVLSRSATPAAIERVRASLDLSAGGDRDALLIALGRSAAGTAALRSIVTEADEDDRRTLATVVGAVADPGRFELLDVLLADWEPSVRAQAAWSAALFPVERVEATLGKLVRAPDADVAANAMASLGRLAMKRSSPTLAKALCGGVADERPLVRANALVGIANTKTRCEGTRERELLADPTPEVRYAAARVLAAKGTPDAALALGECAANDRSPRVARACRERVEVTTGGSNTVEVFVVPFGATTPKPRAGYVLETASGFMRSGTADRRGSLFEPAAPDGELTLRRP